MENEFLDRAQLDEKKAAEKKKKVKTKKKKSAKKQNTPNAFIQILNGDFLTKEFMVNNLNFIFFVMLLLILIVGKGYYGKQLTADVVTTQKKLDDVTSDYFETKAQLEEATQRTRLIEKLQSTGLKETVNPTKVIRIKKDGEH